jgi:hypothetical protein
MGRMVRTGSAGKMRVVHPIMANTITRMSTGNTITTAKKDDGSVHRTLSSSGRRSATRGSLIDTLLEFVDAYGFERRAAFHAADILRNDDHDVCSRETHDGT